MKLLVDMNLSPEWVSFFAQRGISAIHWSSVGSISEPDVRILNYAAFNGLVFFTHDLDFGTLLAAHPFTAPSVVQVRAQNVLPVDIGDLVVRSILGAQAHLDAGALVTIEPSRSRIRVLPINAQ